MLSNQTGERTVAELNAVAKSGTGIPFHQGSGMGSFSLTKGEVNGSREKTIKNNSRHSIPDNHYRRTIENRWR
jgi:hypothetical protein